MNCQIYKQHNNHFRYAQCTMAHYAWAYGVFTVFRASGCLVVCCAIRDLRTAMERRFRIYYNMNSTTWGSEWTAVLTL